MGTTGGDREQLYKTVEDSNIYAVISPQMGKQVNLYIFQYTVPVSNHCGALAKYNKPLVCCRLWHFLQPWRSWLSNFLERFPAILFR